MGCRDRGRCGPTEWILSLWLLLGGVAGPSPASPPAASPLAPDRLGARDARHLLLRAGLGAHPEDIAEWEALTRDQAVDRLLFGLRSHAATPPPEWIVKPPEFPRDRPLTEEERRRFQEIRQRAQLEVRAWWYRELLDTDSPLTERLVLFWHNHFTSSIQKVQSGTLMYRQNQTLRRHGAGSFRELLGGMARDPAMIIYLDTLSNTRQGPNENFARELLELFTLGEGHYSERDIRAAARAFTGWQLEPTTGAFVFREDLHDPGEKEFLGSRGAWTGDDILEILLRQERVSVFITEKLWKEFVSPRPDPGEVERLAAVLRAHDYELVPLLRALFTSPHFWREKNRGTLIKSPVELVVGALRTFRLGDRRGEDLARVGAYLGQDLFAPPTVEGWPGGAEWIDSVTLLRRVEILRRLVLGVGPEVDLPPRYRARRERDRADFERWFTGLGESPESRAARAGAALLASEPGSREPYEGALAVLAELVSDPLFQVR